MSRRRRNPRKRPSRTRRHRESVAAKRRARAFWAMRRKMELAEPPEPAWFRIARIWAVALAAGYFVWTIVKWMME